VVVVIWLYWFSLLYLPSIFRALGVHLQEHPAVRRALAIAYWPVMALIPRIGPLFGSSRSASRYAPLVAVMLCALACTVLWWAAIRLARAVAVSRAR